MAETLFCPKRRAEDAARHRTMGVDVAGPGFGIERRARFVVSELGKGFLGYGIVGENACGYVAWEIWLQALDSLYGPLPNGSCSLRIFRLKQLHAFTQASG
ncbi:MAG TPA: hypothetical protein VFP40_09605, partial [Terriglobales bacterium]|nr:hypothetical protein [Terriglobales bacterium]